MNIDKAYKFLKINELSSCSGALVDVDMQNFSSQGYEVVINLLPDDSKYSTKNEKKLLESQGLQYHYIAVDWDNPKQSDFELFEKIMNFNQGKKIHIHCAANYRATAFYGMYSCKNLDWSREQFNALTAKIWIISDYPVWVQFVSKILN